MKACWPLLFTLLIAGELIAAESASKPEVVKVLKIWDEAFHNGCPDLIRFKGTWFCSFREGADKFSTDGALRVISSTNAENWTSVALFSLTNSDSREPKLSITPDNRLMLNSVEVPYELGKIRFQSVARFSKEGKEWTHTQKIGDTNMWLCQTTWHDGVAYNVAYDLFEERCVRLYNSKDGHQFDILVDNLFDRHRPTEASLAFLSDETCVCLLSRDRKPGSALLGTAKPPYASWLWKNLPVQLRKPRLVSLPGGRLVAAVSLNDESPRTHLAWIEPETATFTEFLELPSVNSAGNAGGAGLVWHDGLLWVSYHSWHKGKTAIYLAQVRIPPLNKQTSKLSSSSAIHAKD